MLRALLPTGSALACALFVSGLTGCFAPPSATARLADSAYELNTATRFGRMDVALENVALASRDDFNARHSGWGKTVRIVDLEYGGLGIRPDGGADVFVTITWQRPDDAIVRTTTLAQKWGETRGTWRLVSEEEKSGDKGLLIDLAKAKAEADKAKADAAAEGAPPQNTARTQARGHYQTRVIYDE